MAAVFASYQSRSAFQRLGRTRTLRLVEPGARRKTSSSVNRRHYGATEARVIPAVPLCVMRGNLASVTCNQRISYLQTKMILHEVIDSKSPLIHNEAFSFQIATDDQ